MLVRRSNAAINYLFESLCIRFSVSSGVSLRVPAKIYAHSGTFGVNGVPTGAALAISDNFDVSVLTTSFQLYTLNFSSANKIVLSNGVKYFIVFEYTDGDELDYIRVGDDGSSPSHSGNEAAYYNGTLVWTDAVGYDTSFYLYTDNGTNDPLNTFVTLADSYSESNSSSYVLINDFRKKVGQTFTASGGFLDKCKFYLKKGGSPTGTAVAKIYNITGISGVDATPTGSALATSDTFDVSTLTTSFALITFTFSNSNKIELSNRDYAIVLEYSNGDASNYIYVASGGLSSNHHGNTLAFSSVWVTSSNLDVIFYVYQAYSQNDSENSTSYSLDAK